MFWPMRSQRQLPHQTPRALPRLPLTPPAQGQNVFSSTVFCLHTTREAIPLLDESHYGYHEHGFHALSVPYTRRQSLCSCCLAAHYKQSLAQQYLH